MKFKTTYIIAIFAFMLGFIASKHHLQCKPCGKWVESSVLFVQDIENHRLKELIRRLDLNLEFNKRYFPMDSFHEYNEMLLSHADRANARFRIILYEGATPIGVFLAERQSFGITNIAAWIRPYSTGWEPMARGPWRFQKKIVKDVDKWFDSIATLTREPMSIMSKSITDGSMQNVGNSAFKEFPIHAIVEIETRFRGDWYYSWAIRGEPFSYRGGYGKDIAFLMSVMEYN
jgi:hypothetical protein